MDLSILIVSYNTKRLTDACLASVIKSLDTATFSWEIVVVDNHSTDQTVEMIEQKYPSVRLIQNTENVGFGKANNQAVAIAKGDYVFFLNSDTVVLNHAISKLYSFAKQHPHSFVAPKLLNPDRSAQTSCGPFFSLPVVFATLFLFGDRLRITRWSPNRVVKVDWVSGAAMMVSRNVMMNGLLFDEAVFMYMEEIDLLYRARKSGHAAYFYPKSLIVHLGSGSSTAGRKGPVLNIYRGYMYLYKKHASGFGQRCMRMMLKAKAILGWTIGMLSGNTYLKETYAEAYRLV